jgi:hypothetical protein
MRYFYSILSVVALLCFSGIPEVAVAQFPAACDGDKSCTGNALTSTISNGKLAQYVDVDTSSRLRALNAAISFEAWLKPTPQPGKRIFVAGLWGPNEDNNDQWVIYIEGTKVTFELSADGSRRGPLDNTVASATVANLYTRGWVHLAAVWDGTSTTARIYIDGTQVGQGSNPQYPLTRLHTPDNRTLNTEIGSCNKLFDDTTYYRTFLGQIDEVRLWNIALTPDQISCQHLLAMAGDEPGLVLYYRCNEQSGAATLCDATGNRHVGRLRSGARCEQSSRNVPASYIITPMTAPGNMYCTSDTLLRYIIVDTTRCGSTVAINTLSRDGGYFTPSKQRITLRQGIPDTFYVRVQVPITGSIYADLDITSIDRCSKSTIIPLSFRRSTELSYWQGGQLFEGTLQLDTLWVGCTERTVSRDTLRICNSVNRPMKIDSLTFDSTLFRWRPLDAARPLPWTLKAGECWSVVIEMDAADTTKTYRDTLRVHSDDKCLGAGIIPVEGRTQDVLILLSGDGMSIKRFMAFGRICPGQLSDVQVFQFRSMVDEPFNIDTMEYDNGFLGRRYVYPLQVLPNFAYDPTFVRFRPDRPGPFAGELRVRVQFRGCTIVKKISLSGIGISVEVSLKPDSVLFGNVTVGKSSQQIATATNTGADARTVSAYLKVGDVFRIVAGASLGLAPGESKPITVEFRPREAKKYYDTLCLFDQGCYGTICIPISGTGVYQDLSFTPPFVDLANVLGCQCRDDSVQVFNASNRTVNITGATLNSTGTVIRFTRNPVAGTGIGTLAPGAHFTYYVTYCPNDISTDRADEAFIDLRLADGQLYQVLVRASSVTPKLYLTQLTTYGIVEVGVTRLDSVLVENISSVPVHVTGATVPAGYSVTGYSRAMPTTLAPRDSLWVYVQFAPTAQASYDGKITLNADAPCALTESGDLSGKGIIIKLDVPVSFMNYGMVKPCDCVVREIPLPNASERIPISIDSVWIDGGGLNWANPGLFSWTSRQTGGSSLPYPIAPKSIDTLLISFCPNVPADDNFLISNAMIHIKASTTVWKQEFTTTLSGRREMNFKPNRLTVPFVPTRVDTSALPLFATIDVPDPFVNPSGDSVVITGYSFVPDQRVFSVREVNNLPLPWVILRGEKLRLEFGFYPRAPRNYRARLHLQTSFPCQGVDTSILVTGSGFAPAFGMVTAFDTSNIGRDTFRLNTCDTLELPVMLNRGIPQDLIDILFRIGYDSTALKLVDIRSPYADSAIVRDTGDGARAYLKNARNVPEGQVATVRFIVISGATRFPVYLDEFDFDSDSLVFYKIITTNDSAMVIIDEPMIAITSTVNFDTVNVRNCADRQVVVYNPGAIPVRFDSLGNVPFGHRVTASDKAYPLILNPGDSITLTLTFCPYIEQTYDTALTAMSSWPCPIADTAQLHSVGFAPPFPMRMLLDPNPNALPVISGMIADTIEVPILVDRDIPQTPLDLNFALEYNRRALQFLDISSTYTANATGTHTGSGVDISIQDCDSVRTGEVGRARFLVAVPDVVVSTMHITGFTFASDSAWWVTLQPTGDTAEVRVDPHCNITRLEFTGSANKLSAPTPNPASHTVAIEVEFFEEVTPGLRIFNAAGIEVLQLLDAADPLRPGRYRLEFDTRELPTGEYFCVFEAGRFRATERLVVVK